MKTWSEELLWDNNSSVSFCALKDEREQLIKFLNRHPDIQKDVRIEGSYVTIKKYTSPAVILAVCAMANHCAPWWLLDELDRIKVSELADFTAEEREQIKECLEVTVDRLRTDIKSFEDKAEQFIKGL